ncbi:MAG: beta-galactosidase, partial [Thermodesulfobacteriota bacterium]|nr:beta-galactosidase [Thermodesulfobacteriota bacterium]
TKASGLEMSAGNVETTASDLEINDDNLETSANSHVKIKKNSDYKTGMQSYEKIVINHAELVEKLRTLEKLNYYSHKQYGTIDTGEIEKQLNELEVILIKEKNGFLNNMDKLSIYSEQIVSLRSKVQNLQNKTKEVFELNHDLPEKYFKSLYFGVQTFKQRDFFQDNGYFPALVKQFGFDFVSFHPHAINYSMAMANPEKGQYNFQPYLELAKSLEPYDIGLRLTVDDSGFHGVKNYWIKKKTDEVTWIDGAGRTRDRLGAHSTLNIWNPDVVKWVTDYASALSEQMKNIENIDVYEVFNESMMFIQKPVGYGRFAVAAFHQYLKNIYNNDVKLLNAKWGTNYDGFSSIIPPRDITPESSFEKTGQIYDFQKFRQTSYINFLAAVIDAIKKNDRDAKVCSQFYERLKVRKKRDKTKIITGGIDFYKLAMLDWDVLGNHDWPDSTEAVDFLYTYSINRYASHEMWDDEFVWTAWEGFSDISFIKKWTPFKNNGEKLLRNVLKRNIWRHLNWSKQGLIFFDLDSPWPGWNYALLDPETSGTVMRYCTGIIPVIKKRAEAISDILVHSKIKNSGVYVLFSNVSRLVSFPHGKSVELCRKTVKELLSKKMIPFVLPEGALIDNREDLSGCKILVCPYTTHMDPKACLKIFTWVKSGGKIVLIGPCGKFDQYGRLSNGLYDRFFDMTLKYDSVNKIWAEKENSTTINRSISFGQGTVEFISSRWDTVSDKLGEIVYDFNLVSTNQDLFEIIPKVVQTGDFIVVVQNLDPEHRLSGKVIVNGAYTEAVDLSLNEYFSFGPGITSQKSTSWFSLQLEPGGIAVIRLR